MDVAPSPVLGLWAVSTLVASGAVRDVHMSLQERQCVRAFSLSR